MNIPLPDLENAARDIVQSQMREGDLDSLTKANVRKKVEQHFGLESGSLSIKPYKHSLNLVIQTAVNEFDQEEIGAEERMSVNQPNVRLEIQKGPRIPQRSNTMANYPKPQSTKKRRGESSSKEYKSAAYVVLSDIEDEAEPADIISNKGDNKSYSPLQKRRKVDHTKDIHVPMFGKHDNSEPESPILPDEYSNEMEKNKAKTSGKDGKKKKLHTDQKGKQKGNSTSTQLSKDEATIKRLKSFVTACGMRRPWVKLLEGCDTSSQQIKRLKEILTELGMSGRMSLDQAKKIKAKRELAKELEEVQSFAQPILGPPPRGTIKTKPRGDQDPDDDESEEDTIPTKRSRRSALQSITAFLGDQSDD